MVAQMVKVENAGSGCRGGTEEATKKCRARLYIRISLHLAGSGSGRARFLLAQN